MSNIYPQIYKSAKGFFSVVIILWNHRPRLAMTIITLRDLSPANFNWTRCISWWRVRDATDISRATSRWTHLVTFAHLLSYDSRFPLIPLGYWRLFFFFLSFLSSSRASHIFSSISSPANSPASSLFREDHTRHVL